MREDILTGFSVVLGVLIVIWGIAGVFWTSHYLQGHISHTHAEYDVPPHTHEVPEHTHKVPPHKHTLPVRSE